jgi:plasmid stabilization system protein ParE
MTYRVLLTDRAASDLDEAYRWYAERSEEGAVRWYDGFVDALATLERNPERCALARENRKFSIEIRQLPYGRRRNWRALFTVREDAVVVLHIRHTARREVTPDDFQ